MGSLAVGTGHNVPMTQSSEPRAKTSITLTRLDAGAYEAVNAAGTSVRVGGEGAMSPVELLLVALAGCSAIDVDVVTSRRAAPTRFEVTASGRKSTEGGNHLEDVALTFPEGPDGDAARARIDNALRASHERDCTVSRTVELATPVAFERAD